MAWDYGKKRWQMTFQSLRGKNCQIDIYQRGYTANDVTTLLGTDKPVSWDEDDDDSLLSVLRDKTGYINVIEETYGTLNTLFPATDIDHYVEVYYDSVCVFSGFLQAQSFDLPYESSPRKIKIPIMSPLAVASGIKMDILSTPSFITVGDMLKRACNKLDAKITQVIFPTGITLDSGYTADLTWKINTLAFCEYNPDYDNYKQHDQVVFVAKDVEYVIEGICNCYGLIVHDFPGMLVFAKVDYNGTYGLYNIDTLDGSTITPVSTIDSSVVTDYSNINILSNRGSKKNIMPCKKIEISYEGKFEKDIELKFNYAKYWWWTDTGDGKQITLNNYDPALASQYWNTGNFPMNDLTPPPYGEDWKWGVWLAKYGSGSMDDKILVRLRSGLSPTVTVLEWDTWYMPPLLTYPDGSTLTNLMLSMDVERSTYNGGALTLEKADGLSMRFFIKIGDEYWNGSQWTNTATSVSATTDTDGHVKIVMTGKSFSATNIHIRICVGGMDGANYMYGLSKIKVSSSYNDVFDEIIPYPLTSKDIERNNGSFAEESVAKAFNLAVNTQNMVMASSNVLESAGMPTQYLYMFQLRKMLSIDTLLERTPYIYLYKIKFETEYPRKKIISCGFTPSEDEMSVMMQGINTL